MSLLEPPVEKPQKSRVMAFTVAALAFTLAVVLWFTFRYYPEKKAASQFFDALVAGETQRAYELWKPSPSYKIMGAKAPKGGNSIEVNIAISPFSPMPDASDGDKSRKTRVVTLWVLPADKSLSFPP